MDCGGCAYFDGDDLKKYQVGLLKEKIITCLQRHTMEAVDYDNREPFRTKEGYWIEQIFEQNYKLIYNYDSMAREVMNIMKRNLGKCRNGSQVKLDWFFIDMLISFANDKKNSDKVRSQKHQEVFNYNGSPYTVTFQRGDVLNG